MKITQRLMLIFIFIVMLTLIIAFTRGYRLDFKKKTVTPTGILAITSFPKAAKVYVNGELKSVTDINLTVPPGSYQIEIKKDGYTSWGKTVKVKGELVISLEALLFPANPSLSPLTNLGLAKAVSLDQTDRILLFSQTGDETKDGFYLFDAGKKTLSFLSPLKLILKKTNIPNFNQIDFSKTEVSFSPDYKQAILELTRSVIQNSFRDDKVAYLISLDEENKTSFDVTASKETLLSAWEKEKEKDNLKILEIFPKDFTKIASDSSHIIAFSPDETKMLYQVKKSITLPLIINPPLIASNQTDEERTLKKDNLYVYDKKEDKNYKIDLINLISKQNTKNKNNLGQLEQLEIRNFLQWYPDSKHLTFLDKEKISVIDYDGTNKQAVYSGPLEKDFFAVSSDGNLIILTNLNPETNPLPDLYSVGIK